MPTSIVDASTLGDGVDESARFVGRTARRDSPGDNGRGVDWETCLSSAVVVLSSLVIMAHMGLTLGGDWGGDEYYQFANWRDVGLSAFRLRLLAWSPRPTSEVVLYFYFCAVNYWRSSLITPFLGILWLLLVTSALAPAWYRGTTGLRPRLAVATTALAMFLLGRRIFELFYWPMGTAAYLLSLVGIVMVTFQTIAGRTASARARLICCIGLLVSATSSEIGLFFVVGYTAAMILLDWIALPRHRAKRVESSAWYLIPFLASLVVAAWILMIVISNPGRGMGDGGIYFHHFWPSLVATLRRLGPELILGDGSPAGLGRNESLVVAGLLFVGFAWGCRTGHAGPVNWRHMMALIAGLSASFGISILSSYYEYGTPGQEQHNAFRHCIVVLLLLTGARIVAAVWKPSNLAMGLIGPLALIGAISLPLTSRLPKLVADYSLLPRIREARVETWGTGMDPSAATVRFQLPPNGSVLPHFFPETFGHFVQGAPGTEWWMAGIMAFFHKQALDVVPPSADALK